MIANLLATFGVIALLAVLLAYVYAKGFKDGAECQEKIENDRKQIHIDYQA